MVAAAVGVASVAGTAIAGSEAAGATTAASNAAIQEQNTALAAQTKAAAPYTALGQSAVPQLQSLLGIGTPGQNGQPTSATQLAALRNTPGYQFQQAEGTQNTLNAANASGLLNSGNTLQALSEFNQGLADTTYQQAVGNAENVVNTGQAAAAGQAANIGNAANNISSNLINQGNTLAGIDANVVAGITKSAGNAANTYTTNNTLAGLDSAGAGNLASDPGAYQDYVAGGPTMPAGGGYTYNTPGYP